MNSTMWKSSVLYDSIYAETPVSLKMLDLGNFFVSGDVKRVSRPWVNLQVIFCLVEIPSPRDILFGVKVLCHCIRSSFRIVC